MLRYAGTARAAALTAAGLGVLWLLAAPLTADPSAWLVTGVMLAAATGAAAGAAATACRVSPARPWWLLAAGAAAWAAGALAWALDAAFAVVTLPAASVADVFYLAYYPLVAAALLRMPWAPRTFAARLRAVLDGLVAAAALVAASWPWLLGPIRSGQVGSLLGTVVATAYPLGDVLLLGVLASLAAHRTGVDRRVAALLGGGGLVLAAADVGYVLVVNAGGTTLGEPINLAYLLGFALVAAATVAARRTPPTPAVAASPRASLVAQAPLLPLVPGLAVAAYELALHRTLAPGVAVPLLVALALVLVRQSIAVQENQALSHGLERLVAAKTATLTELAYGDQLTGLANRRRLLEDLTAVAAEPEADQPGWLLVLDLGGFTDLNDSLGHSAGDEALRQCAGRLRQNAAASHRLYRLGGAEFAVLLGTTDGDTAVRAGRRHREALAATMSLDGHRVQLRAWAGLAPVGGAALETLRAADLALSAAKAREAEPVRVFDQNLADAAAARLNLESDLRQAIEDDQLTLAYQPIFDLASGRPVGAEALVRWTHPERGPVGPDEFIPVAERCGLVLPLGSFVMREAVRNAAEWRGLSGQPFDIWVNLSVSQLERPHAAEALTDLLAAYGLPPRAMVLEVTEGLFMAPDGLGAAALHQLRRQGVRVAIDDFGTGYSSLSYLDRLPVDILKMDRHFVTALDDITRDATTTRGVIALAASLRLTLVAEGIETEGQLAALQAAGCRLGQGYLLQRPTDAASIRDLLGIGAGRSSNGGPSRSAEVTILTR